MNVDFKKLLPHLIAVAVFLIVSLIYCKPALEGMVLNAHDNRGWKGMAQQSFEYKEKYGRFPLWTNSMFSGMPAYQIAIDQDYTITNQWLSWIYTLGLPKPVNFFFLACLSFYLLALVLGINPWIAMMSGLSYGFATYNPIIVSVGHDTKMLAIGYAPLVIAGLLLLFKKRWALGAVLFASGFSLQVSTGHLQIVYYTALIAGFCTIGYLIASIRQKELKPFLAAAGIAIVLALIGVGTNATTMLTTYEYSKESMRGGISELKDSKDKNKTAGGLDKDYAFKYSVGIAETFTIILPGLYGGSNGGNEYKSSKFADKLTELGYPEDQALEYANGMSYWGNQQPTSGPVYFGAIIILLFLYSLFQKQNWLTWSLLASGIFGILLSWGNNFEALNYFLFDYLPFYKKFRAPSMGLFMPQLSFVLLAATGSHNLIFGEHSSDELKKYLKKGAIATGVVIIALAAMYLSFDFVSPNDKGIQENMANAMMQQGANNSNQAELKTQANEFGKQFVSALREDRRSIFGSDLFRALVLLSLGIGVLYMATKQKLKAQYAAIILLALSAYDLLSIGKKYLNENSFVDQSTFESDFTMSSADQQIKQDTGYFRVLNQATDPFNESTTSYFHRSIGGYHPAKLQIYQDLVEFQISKFNMQVINMLNTKYVIQQDQQSGQPIARLNPDAYGPCWLVKGIKYVNDGKAEMSALDQTNLRDTAVVQTKYKNIISSQPVFDSTAVITLKENRNDIIKYETKAASNQFAVLSEVWYSAGWHAYLDGKKTEFVKTNYALRGIPVPAGNHQIEFRFEPASYKTGNLVSLITTILLYLVIAGGLTVSGYRLSVNS